MGAKYQGRINFWLVVLGLMALLALTGCKSGKRYTGNIERSNLYKDYSSLSRQLTGSGERVSPTDTIPVAAFPMEHLEIAGQEYTLMDLGFPYYDPGGVTTYHDPGYYDPTTKTWMGGGTYTIVVNASYGIARGDSTALVAVPLTIPIKRKRTWIFWTKKNPDLIYFPARVTGRTIEVDGRDIQVLAPAAIFPVRIEKNAEVTSLRSKVLGVRGPLIPEHLKQVWRPPFLVVNAKVQLPGPNVPVSPDTRLSLNIRATKELFVDFMDRNDPLVGELGKDDSDLIMAWLEASGVMVEANRYHRKVKTPTFVAVDKPGLTQRKRDEKALELADEAKELDPRWVFPDDFKVEVNSSILKGDSEVPPTGSGSFRKLSLGLDLDAKRLGLTPNKFGDNWTAYFGFGIKYQLSNSLALGATWKPYLFWKPFDFKKGVLERYAIRGLYQTPIRIQLGNQGYRLELEAAYLRLPQVIENGGVDYRYDEPGYEIALGLSPRRDYWLGKGDQPWRLQFGYYWGPDGEFVSSDGDVYRYQGAKVVYHPEGIFIRFELSFGLF